MACIQLVCGSRRLASGIIQKINKYMGNEQLSTSMWHAYSPAPRILTVRGWWLDCSRRRSTTSRALPLRHAARRFLHALLLDHLLKLFGNGRLRQECNFGVA